MHSDLSLAKMIFPDSSLVVTVITLSGGRSLRMERNKYPSVPSLAEIGHPDGIQSREMTNHVFLVHHHPRLGKVYPVLGKNDVISDIHRRVDDLVLIVQQENKISWHPRNSNLVVVILNEAGGILVILHVRIGCLGKKIQGSPVTVRHLLLSRWW